MKTNLTKKQAFSISVIVAIGILLAVLIIVLDKNQPLADAHGQSKHVEHADEKHEGKSDDEPGTGEHAKHDAHGDGDPHKKESTKGPHAESGKKIEMTDDQIKAADIAIHSAAAGRINSSLTLPGEIRYNEDNTAHVVPRLAGVVESVRASLGQKVKKGQVLAVLASADLSEQRSELLTAQKRHVLARTTYEREKKLWQDKISAEQDYQQAQQVMQEAEIAVRNAQQKLSALGASAVGSGHLGSYEIRAPFDGMVMEKHISLGEAVKADANVFTISDLSTVWAELAVPPKDLNALRVGEKVSVKASAFAAQSDGTIAYVGALLGEQTRTATARVILANPDMAWRPGLFVTVEVVSDQSEVPVTVAADAVHTVDEKSTVYVRVPGGFVPQHVTLGRSDGKLVEVMSGLKAGAQYAGQGSFIVKSEQGKASAEHSH